MLPLTQKCSNPHPTNDGIEFSNQRDLSKSFVTVSFLKLSSTFTKFWFTVSSLNTVLQFHKLWQSVNSKQRHDNASL